MLFQNCEKIPGETSVYSDLALVQIGSQQSYISLTRV